MNTAIKLFFLSTCTLALLLWANLHIADYLSQSGLSELPKISSSSPSNHPTPTNHFNRTLKGPGVISKVHGGIGNQLFHFACTYALARELNRPLYNYLPGSLTPSRRFTPGAREFALDKFQLPLDNQIDVTTLINRTTLTVLNDSQLLSGNFSRQSDLLQLSGSAYCASQAYWIKFKEEILPMFQLRPEVVQQFPPHVHSLSKEILHSPESVMVHVRRGDFNNGFDIPITFHRAAIRRLIDVLQDRLESGRSKGPPTFFVFSDNIKYAKGELEDFAKSHRFVFVGAGNRTTSLEDFYLMTKCKHFVVTNSTFSWWVAYLGTNWRSSDEHGSSVIASKFNPKFWNHYKPQEKRNFYKMLLGRMYYPEGWKIIDVFGENGTLNSFN